MIQMYQLNQENIKHINKVNILNILRNNKEMTKHEISEQLNLSIPTVTTNINLLMEQDLVEYAGVAESTGGRKPVIIKIKKDSRYSVGVDITPEKARIILMNLYSEIVDEIEVDFKKDIKFKYFLDEIMIIINECLKVNYVKSERVLGIGFSLPGIVDEEKLTLTTGPNIGVNDFSFIKFKKESGFDIYIENEANAAAYGELVLGNANNNLVYISITEGVGTGIIINHNIYKSIYKKAGEFGHMRVTNDQLRCSCGRTGCWELYTSKRSLLNNYKNLSGYKINSVEELIGKYNQGDEKAKEVLENYIRYLFIGIENIIMALDPQYVIIGGEIAKFKNDIKSLIETCNLEDTSSIDDKKNQVIFSSLEDRGALLGAALLPFEQLFHFTKNVL
ncbi:MAG: ROK family transcriptional regulator [Eubacteriales bacterium]